MVVLVVLGVVVAFSSALFIMWYQSRQARDSNFEIERETTHLPEIFGAARSFD
jgi:hypothetical protein